MDTDNNRNNNNDHDNNGDNNGDHVDVTAIDMILGYLSRFAESSYNIVEDGIKKLEIPQALNYLCKTIEEIDRKLEESLTGPYYGENTSLNDYDIVSDPYLSQTVNNNSNDNNNNNNNNNKDSNNGCDDMVDNMVDNNNDMIDDGMEFSKRYRMDNIIGHDYPEVKIQLGRKREILDVMVKFNGHEDSKYIRIGFTDNNNPMYIQDIIDFWFVTEYTRPNRYSIISTQDLFEELELYYTENHMGKCKKTADWFVENVEWIKFEWVNDGMYPKGFRRYKK